MSLAPAHWDILRPMETAAILLAVGREHGLSTRQCLANSGLTARQVEDPLASVTARQELALIRNLLVRLGPDLPLGLAAGQRYQLSTFGIWGFAVINAGTMREAVEVGVRYARLTAAWCAPHIEDRGDQAVMKVSTDALPEDVSQFLLERDAAILITLQRQMLPLRMPLTYMRCTFARPSYHTEVDAFFGTRVRYDQAENAIAVPAGLGQVPVPRHNSAFFRRCERECQRLLDEQQRYEGLAGRVRQVLTPLLQGAPTMDSVGDALGVHPRTLRRHLAREQVDFETLVAETRQTLAEQMLRITDFTVAEIAEQLGYRHSANFVRAFRRWHGLTPLQWKRGLRQQQ